METSVDKRTIQKADIPPPFAPKLLFGAGRPRSPNKGYDAVTMRSWLALGLLDTVKNHSPVASWRGGRQGAAPQSSRRLVQQNDRMT